MVAEIRISERRLGAMRPRSSASSVSPAREAKVSRATAGAAPGGRLGSFTLAVKRYATDSVTTPHDI